MVSCEYDDESMGSKTASLFRLNG